MGKAVKQKTDIRRVSYRLPVAEKLALERESEASQRTETAVLIRAIRKAYPAQFRKT